MPIEKEDILLGVGIAVLAAGAVPIILGFGTVGITAGSAAAAIQSGIGNVVAGSLFAKATSLGMTGVFTGLTSTGGIMTSIGAACKFFSK